MSITVDHKHISWSQLPAHGKCSCDWLIKHSECCPEHIHTEHLKLIEAGKFKAVSDSRSGFLMSRASFQVPTCLCFNQWLLKWLVMQTAAASSAAAVCITRCFSNRWPRFPKFTRPQWVNGNLKERELAFPNLIQCLEAAISIQKVACQNLNPSDNS